MKINKFISYLICISFIIFSFVSVIDMTCFNMEFYKYEYPKNEVAQNINISEDDLYKATDVLLGYIKGDYDSLDVKVKIDSQEVDMFNEREIKHMVDVKNLYQIASNIRYVALVIFILSIIYLIFDKCSFIYQIFEAYQKSLIFLLVLLGILLTIALCDFSLFWTSFHKLIFTNDLWLLNPLTDRLILMVPSGFFFDLVLLIVILFVLIQILAYFLLKKGRKKYGY